MNKIKKIFIPSDFFDFFLCYFVVIPILIYLSVYIYTGYSDFNYAKQNIMEYYQKNKLFEKTYPATYYILIGQRTEYANKKIVRCGE